MKKVDILYILILSIVITFGLTATKNACKTFEAYFYISFSSDCYYHPDVYDDTFGIIQRHVGFHETHQVQTEDGYILGLIRIPRKNSKGVILMQHPLSSDCRIYLAQFDQSLPFVLWRAGYDVWLGNSRGNFYSKKHVTLRPSEASFWNYSLHELGYHDVHATIGYIRSHTNGSKLIYFGYSMGGSVGLIYASTRSEEAADSVKLMIAVAPVSFFNHGRSIVRHIVPPIFRLQRWFQFVDLNSPVTEHDVWYLRFIRLVARNFPVTSSLASYPLYLLFGWTPKESDPNLVTITPEKFGSGISLKVYDHLNECFINGGLFLMYDHGEEGNLRLYGQRKPPLYPVENIKVPIFLISGQNDSMIDPLDNEVLYSRLPVKSKVGNLTIEGFNHIDFLFGKHRVERFHAKIIQLLNRT